MPTGIVGPLVVSVAVGILIGLPVGAILLRISCSICRAAAPGFWKAIGVTALLIVASFGVSIVWPFVAALVLPADSSPVFMYVVSIAVTWPPTITISAFILSWLLPEKVGRSFRITIVFWVMNLIITLAVFGSIALFLE